MRIGIDLGGTKTEGILLSSGKEVIKCIRTPTPQNQGYQAIIDNIVFIVNKLEEYSERQCSVGIGTPGSIIKNTGLMKYSNTVCLNDQPLLKDLELSLKRPIRIENDANCFALSEASDGAGQGNRCVFGVIMGTGVGGGLVIDQNILKGPNGMTGEWGHTVLNPNGEPCYCGQKGCIETLLSGPGLTKQFHTHGGDKTILTAEDIIKLAQSGDSVALTTLDHFFDHFCQSISTIIKILDPDIIVIGGGLSNINSLYTETSNRLCNYFSSPIEANIVKNKHGDSSGVRGAAILWDEK